jgi:ubiquinol-cytochrome c reductase cytochrome c1 subunit|tara:strand:- start:13356 stop:14144 length:789 start_codon:yes stop_codon:yes gene_type:complete
MFKKILIVAFVFALFSSINAGPLQAAEGAAHPASQEWTTDGLFGFFDRKQLKRGWQVYSEICASCHSVRLVYYRHLEEIGFSPDEVKKIAAEAEVAAGPNEDGETHNDGELIVRPGKPFDKIVSPYPNDLAARAANAGALPPDLSLMTKARKNGANYLHALLTGYKEAPADFKLTEDMNYNPYFPGSQIAMGEPLSDDGVEYADGTKATVDQMSKDITAFLVWAAEPELEERKRMGVKVMLFLIIFTAMLYAVKRQVWAKLH